MPLLVEKCELVNSFQNKTLLFIEHGLSILRKIQFSKGFATSDVDEAWQKQSQNARMIHLHIYEPN